jgi:hypothetical protein
MLISSVLEDINLVTETDRTALVDRSKVRRKRAKIRDSTKQTEMLSLKGIYFDGRKDKTLFYKDERKQILSEEHIVLIAEPGEHYLTHVSPKSGTAKGIAVAIMEYLENNPLIDITNLRVLGCDGTNVNTGTILLIIYI